MKFKVLVSIPLNFHTNYYQLGYHQRYSLPPKLAKSVVNSERFRFQSCPSDPNESLDEPMWQCWASCKSSELATTDVKVASSPDASRAIPDISDGGNGKWLFDATDAGLPLISDIALHGTATSGAPPFIEML